MGDDDDDDDDLFSYRAKGGDDGDGAARSGDPETSKLAARSIKTAGIMWQILQYLLRTREPRNGWEIAVAIGMENTKDTAVPRLAPLRRQGAIQIAGVRPGPSNRAQVAYLITDKGRAILRHEIGLVIAPPFEAWEIRSVLQEWLWRALQDGWTAELEAEVRAGFATYEPNAEDSE